MNRKVFSLRELAQHLAPRTFWYWERAEDYLSQWSTTAAHEIDERQAALRRRDVLDWRPGVTWEMLEAERAKFWAEIGRRLQMERRRTALHNRLMEKIRAVLTSPDCVIRGIGPAGTQVVVPRTIVPQLEIDLKRQVVSTKGGTWSKWEAVVVEWRPDEGSKRTDRKAKQKEALALVIKLYGGVPDDTVSVPDMQKRVREEEGRTFGLDVIRRGLGRKR